MQMTEQEKKRIDDFIKVVDFTNPLMLPGWSAMYEELRALMSYSDEAAGYLYQQWTTVDLAKWDERFIAAVIDSTLLTPVDDPLERYNNAARQLQQALQPQALQQQALQQQALQQCTAAARQQYVAVSGGASGMPSWIRKP